ncbi:MAG: response regulator [Actinomycetes bacterium]
MSVVRQHRTALVVDDSAGARRRIGTLLRLGGWRVHEAVGMEAALAAAAGLAFDLVVTDMTMRRGNGPLLMRTLRAHGCAARFVAVSSEVTDEVRARAAAADASACLAKPVEPRLLVDVLLGLTHPPTAERQAPPPALRVPAERLDAFLELRAAALTDRPEGAAAADGGRAALPPAADRVARPA